MNNKHDMNFQCLYHSGLIESIKAVCTKMDEREKLVNNKFESIEKSVNVARVEMDRRLEGMNEFRMQLDKQVVTFPTRAELSSELTKLQIQIDSNAIDLKTIKETRANELGARKWSDYIIMILLSAIIFSIMKFIFKQ